MAEEVIELLRKSGIIELVRKFRKLWVAYDADNDVLYVSFKKPERADESKILGNFIVRFREGEMVGVTVLHASQELQ